MINEKKLIKDLEEKVRASVKVGEWIPCSERLPEKHDSYFVAWRLRGQSAEDVMKRTYSHYPHYCEILEFSPLEGWTEEIQQARGHEYEILAWQPLPEPWKGNQTK